MGHIMVIMSLWGRTLFAKGMFYYSPKIYSQLNFHLSEHATRRLHAVLEAETVMLAEAVQLASKYWLTLSVSTIGGNHSRMIPGQDRNRQREETQHESSRSGIIKYLCKHDTAWRLTAPSFLSSLRLRTAQTKVHRLETKFSL